MFALIDGNNFLAGPPSADVFDELRKLLARSLAIRTFSIHAVDADITQRRGLMEEAIRLMASGSVRAPRAMRMQLAQARQAHELLDSGGTLGKLVLIP